MQLWVQSRIKAVGNKNLNFQHLFCLVLKNDAKFKMKPFVEMTNE